MIPREQAEQMYEVNAILRMNAEKLGCKVSDLQWKRDEGGHIHVRRKQCCMKNVESVKVKKVEVGRNKGEYNA